MQRPRIRRPSLFTLAVILSVPSLRAQVYEFREYHGKKVLAICPSSFSPGYEVRACGIYGYDRVFTGTVKSATEISDTDRRLVVIPDEIFLGPATEVTVRVNQACLPVNETEIQAGDRWLFFVKRPRSRQDGQSEVWLPANGRSGPLTSSSAQEEISTLRHLERLTDSGVITGLVTHTEMKDHKIETVPVPDWAVRAKPFSGGPEYKVLTDSNGHFEFELPQDSYDVTANTQRGVLAPEHAAFVESGRCVDVDFPVRTDGRVSGTVRTADGSAASNAEIAILRVSPWPDNFTVQADKRGHFEIRGLEPGRYIIGAGVLATTLTEWRLRVYYPGVTGREHAIPIDLGKGERRTNLDFKLTPTSTSR
jgi:hypothetical protein